MKRLFLVLLCVAVGSVSLAQSRLGYGPKVALNISNVNFDKFAATPLTHKARVGVAFGAFASYKFNDWLGAQAEAMYSTQGSKLTMKTTPALEGKLIVNYINVPVFAKFYPLEGLHIDVGPQVGFLVRKELDFGSVLFTPDYNSVDFSIVMGAGYEFNCGFCVDARYALGVTDIIKKDSDGKVKSRNGVFEIGAGYKF